MGFVYFVGAGPGDAQLITLKGLNIIKKADVILYDKLAGEELLDYAKPTAKKICVGKRAGHHSKKQEEINSLLCEYAKKPGLVVARLKGGDSFVFGRGSEEAAALDGEKLPYAFVPGVSSCYAVPELSGIPVTHRSVAGSFSVITGHTKDGIIDEKTIEAYAKTNGALVFLMGLAAIEEIADLLIKHGRERSTPTAVISNGSTANQKTVRGALGDIAEKVKREKLQAPAVIVVGETAGFDFSKKIKIGLTGSEEIKSKLRSGIDFAEAYDILNTEFKKLDFELPELEKYDMLAFLSSKAVEFFFDKAGSKPLEMCVGAVGSQTAAALKKHGVSAALIPKSFSSEVLASEIIKGKFKNVLIIRCKKGSNDMERRLKEKNINAVTLYVYDAVTVPGADYESADEMDYITFSSAGSAEAFFKEHKPNGRTKYAAIGSVTAREIEKNGVKPLCASEFTAQGIVNAVWEDVI